MSTALEIHFLPCHINNVYTMKWRLMFCWCTLKMWIWLQVPSVLYFVHTFNGTSADPGGILCAGLVVSPWIVYEIFESPERCMMNEVACYLYAYRAHWLATGSAKGSGSKWNSAPGQYIIKRNVCTWNLQAFFRCGQGAWRGGGRGRGWDGRGEERVGSGRTGEGFFVGWVRSKQREAGDFVESVLFSYWLICVF